jgi:hypothetical protein
MLPVDENEGIVSVHASIARSEIAVDESGGRSCTARIRVPAPHAPSRDARTASIVSASSRPRSVIWFFQGGGHEWGLVRRASDHTRDGKGHAVFGTNPVADSPLGNEVQAWPADIRARQSEEGVVDVGADLPADP